MRLLLLLFLFNFSLSGNSMAQDYTTLGNPGTETFNALTALSNGGFAVAGKTRTKGAGSDDMSVHLFDGEGRLKACYVFGTEKSDIPYDIRMANNGDILMVGQGFEGESDPRVAAFIYRMDRFGSLLWKRALKGRSGYVVKEMKNGIIAVGGFWNNDYMLALLSVNGEVLLETVLGTEYKDYAFGLLETSDNGLLMGGVKAGFHSPEGHDFNISNTDLLFIKIAADGTELWRKEIGGDGHDFMSYMEMGDDGNIYIVGSTQGDGQQSFDAFLMKMDEEANIIWQEYIGGDDFEYGLDLSMDQEGDIYICGATNSNTNSENPDLFTAKYDQSGNQLWYKQLGSSGSEYANGIQVTTTGEIVLVGSSTQANETDYLVAKLDSDGNLITLTPLNPESQILLLFPNPTTDYITLAVATNIFCQDFTYLLHDMDGKLLINQKVFGSITLNLTGYSAGMYAVTVLLEDGTKLVEKIIKY